MKLTEKAKAYLSKMFSGEKSGLEENDPEFAERFYNFAFDEVVNQGDMDDKTRMLAILATLTGCQGTDAYRVMAKAALRVGVTPVEIKEVTYQAVAYLGIGRVLPFFAINNEILKEDGVSLPLEAQAKTTMETRLEAGIQAQVYIFGDGMKEFYKSGPEESRHINRWLADNCFGDYYTRKGLDYRQREMI
ncbi:MAG: carboxymuconolactone decarboxylase family protein, partial [Lachnospiraceae bacterium]|nr:carboxymuconolactone decarboxylase family protein [Lachnospiraceae bacterium]